ncbi:MAG: response regulator [Desulfarculus sp.]|nr:response regulator [Pseudomonadota bacterium]MBV1715822.1 response regulator [Desulfarculus sp.]MBU4574624.1 response regulator [Pseudomonadota bacterium]MBU4597359.1 response regulator [Pseudomonadota bacterium]MBV1739177.1 response regulator [Desulfarculus sp.]
MNDFTPASSENSPGRLSILLVDDEPNIREALAEYLTSLNNHSLTTAASGPEALEKFQPGKFDCAFLDLKMPGMNGVELLAQLKELDKTLPVVIMTGFPSLDAAIDTMRQGASDFLVKPFNLDQVKATLERVVREHRLLQENLRLSERLKHQERIERLNQELSRRVREQQVLHQISEAIDHMHTSEAIYQGIADLSATNLEAGKTAVLLLEPSSGQLVAIAVSGFSPEVVGQVAGQLDQGLFGKAAAGGKPVMGHLESMEEAGRLLAVSGSMLCLPIMIHEQTLGLLVLGEKRGGLPFRGEDVFLSRFLLQKAALSVENIALYESMASNLHSTLGALVRAMEAKDPYTRQHSRRVTNLAVLTAEVMGLELHQVESLKFAGYLHDIGKIGIKDHILLKETRLTPAEYQEIKRHPAIGESIVRAMDLSQDERHIVRHHHERWDGDGYPDRLAGKDIPLLARLVAVADAYDAMTSDRSYRASRTMTQAVDELAKCAGNQFDPMVVEGFLQMLEQNHWEIKQDPPVVPSQDHSK